MARRHLPCMDRTFMKLSVNEFAFFLRGQARKNLKLLILYCFFLFVIMIT